MKNNDYKFVPDSAGDILAELEAAYEERTGHALRAADPDKLFIAFLADVITAERVRLNFAANQNIPDRATGENLDALGKWIYGEERYEGTNATAVVMFEITRPQESAVLIPKGTRVTDEKSVVVFETMKNADIAPGSTSVEIGCICTEIGEVGNGYAAGEINKLVDVDNIMYFSNCKNILPTSGGASIEGDEEYFQRLQKSLAALSVAGPASAYEYHAKKVSAEIADVKVVRPTETTELSLSVYADSNGDKVALIGGDYSSLEIDGYADYSIKKSTDGSGVTVVNFGSNSELSLGESINATVCRDGAGQVNVYILMKDGTAANDGVKKAALEALSADDVRPLTDRVSVCDPKKVDYQIDLEYFISSTSEVSSSEVEKAVSQAIDDYIAWQRSALGRDVNPSELSKRVMNAGARRIVVKSPTFKKLSGGENGKIPEYASLSSKKIVCGGYEND